jgi:hypothetical protein
VAGTRENSTTRRGSPAVEHPAKVSKKWEWLPGLNANQNSTFRVEIHLLQRLSDSGSEPRSKTESHEPAACLQRWVALVGGALQRFLFFRPETTLRFACSTWFNDSARRGV